MSGSSVVVLGAAWGQVLTGSYTLFLLVSTKNTTLSAKSQALGKVYRRTGRRYSMSWRWYAAVCHSLAAYCQRSVLTACWLSLVTRGHSGQESDARPFYIFVAFGPNWD
jgi:hypothetical protein